MGDSKQASNTKDHFEAFVTHARQETEKFGDYNQDIAKAIEDKKAPVHKKPDLKDAERKNDLKKSAHEDA